ncbi:MAG TPA: 5'-methylthioadenosine/S-adenosylhomocysteine nucleosidase [Rickettsiales bacterium]|nr:5'-methylthioadenosine/S-adenosylhomocysteine nucleosidase [Rickettsiales bacterium]
MRPLIVMALSQESNGLIEQHGMDVIYTGVGKVNAVFALTQYLANHPATPFVVNVGTAGSRTFRTGEVVAARGFVQRDMDVTGLGFEHGVTPFDPHPAMLEFPTVFHELEHGICGSGDSFLQTPPPIPCDIIDMEAYGLAKVCHLKSIPFACVKYITDGADGSSHIDWQQNLDAASRTLAGIVSRFAV